ncbi:hypothetical protein BSNK01_22490 [Bacillaceae bacterium]
MSLSLYVMLAVIFILSTIVIAYTFRRKSKIPCMTGMMIAMTTGMMVGLTIGVILGIMYAGNLFISTLLAIGIGMSVGFIAGVPVSIMAVLDGMLAGIMGGMMGAMLGEMISTEYRDALIKIMFVLFVGIHLIILYMMQQELNKKNGESRQPLFHHPLMIIFIMGGFFFGYNQLGTSISISQTNHGDSRLEHMQRNDGHTLNGTLKSQNNQRFGERYMGQMILPKSSEKYIPRLVVEAKEYTFSPRKIEIHTGREILLVLKNLGEQEHDLEILGMDAANIGSRTHSQNHSKENHIHLHTKPGDDDAIAFVPLRPGLYRMICTIPGHKESGMEGVVKVI